MILYFLLGIRELKKLFEIGDRDNVGGLDVSSFKILINKLEKEYFQLQYLEDPQEELLEDNENKDRISDAEIVKIFNILDPIGRTVISFDQFMQAVKGPLAPERAILVTCAYDKLDKKGRGFITANDVVKFCSRTIVPDIIGGLKTVNVFVFEFLRDFDGEGDLKVSREKFENYYLLQNYLTESDEKFENYLINRWCLTTEELDAHVLKQKNKFKKGSISLSRVDEDLSVPFSASNPITATTTDNNTGVLDPHEMAQIQDLANAISFNNPSPPNGKKGSKLGSFGKINRGSKIKSSYASVASEDNAELRDLIGFDPTDKTAVDSLVAKMPLSLQMAMFHLDEQVKELTNANEQLVQRNLLLERAYERAQRELNKLKQGDVIDT